MKAKITTIPFGNLSIEGLLLPESTKERPVFGVAVPQAASTFSVRQDNAQRDFKRLLGDDFQIVKISTELNPKKVNVLPLSDFEKLTALLAFSGNVIAKEFVLSLFGLSLHQLFCDAFSLKFEREDRQIWLIERQDGKKARREYTDMIKNLIDNGEEINYGWLTLRLYQSIGIRGEYHQWKRDENAQIAFRENNINFRDQLNGETLRKLKEAELYCTQIVEDFGKPLAEAFEIVENRYLSKLNCL